MRKKITKQKKIIVLGAGPFQLPGIKKARELGYYVITLDYIPNNIGHKYSHFYVNCSTADKEGVLKIAKKMEIDGILTFSSDVAIPTLAYVSNKLQLKGLDFDIAKIITDKLLFRKFQKRVGLPHPKFLSADNFNNIYNQLSSLTLPIVFKPADSSGSRGISLIDSFDRRLCHMAFDKALMFSRSRRVCIEEYIDGIVIGGNGFLLAGRFHTIAITNKYLKEFVVTGHRFPANISLKDQSRVILELERTCQIIGYTNGPLDFDVIVTSERIVIVEMSPRTGGNGIQEIIKYATGTDIIELSLCYAMSELLPKKAKKIALKGCGSYVFGSEITGCLCSLASQEQMQRKIQGLLEYNCTIKPNALVKQFNHGGNTLGYTLFKCLNKKEYIKKVKAINQALDLKVIPEETR